MSRVVMYIFINKGLGMSTGKVAAQASHAAVEAFRVSKIDKVAEWYKGGHYAKLIMQARDEQHLRTISEYIENRGFKVKHIVDEGLTEIKPHQLTAVGVELVDKEDPHTLETFSTFELYRDKVKVTIEVDK